MAPESGAFPAVPAPAGNPLEPAPPRYAELQLSKGDDVTTENAPLDGTAATLPPAAADRIFCPDCERAVFYQRVHVSTHEAECPRD